MDNPIPPNVAYALFVTISSAIIICDVPFLCLIFMNKQLRKQKELIIVGFMCIADTAHALAVLISGAVRLWLFVNASLTTPLITNQDCTRYGFPIVFLFSYQLMGSATLVVTFDRFCAVMRPVFYRSLSERFAFGVMGCLLIYVTTISIFSMTYIHLSAPLPSSPSCFTSECFTPMIWKYLLYFRMSAIVTSSFLYLPISFQIYRMSKALKQKRTKSNFSKKIIKTTRTIGLTVAAEIIFVVMSDIFLTFNLFGLARYQVAWYICAVSKGAVNVLLVTLRHDDILSVLREKFQRIRRGSKIQIGSSMVLSGQRSKSQNEQNANF